MTTSTKLAPRSRLLALAATTLALACALALALGAISGANSSKTIGNTKRSPDPACPKDTNRNPCVAVGSVTAFQVEADGKERLMRAPEDGRLLGWAIDLARLRDRQREFFGSKEIYGNERYGSSPTARIAVLKGVQGPNYKLKQQSPVVELGPLLGNKQFITLNDPLPIKKGEILALTYPTYAPNLALDVNPRQNEWRASRQKGKCNDEQATRADPQQNVGSTREYGCDFNTRILYWGYYVPSNN